MVTGGATIPILFMVAADADNTNAQSLNAREIGLRLDPKRFLSTLFYEREPDPRLVNRAGIRLARLPSTRRTWSILKEMMSGHRVIAYVDYSPAAWLFVHVPRLVRRRAKTVMHAEAPIAQMAGATRLVHFLRDGTVQRCDVCTAITDFVVRDLSKEGIRSQFTLPVGVDTKFFVPPETRKSARPTVLFAGTLIERKGVVLVIEAASRLPEAEFLLVGSARDGFDAVLRKRCEELRVGNVQFLGAQSQAALMRIMQGSDIFLLPSRLEGLPKVTLEAAATGLPCVVFRDYETPSVVDSVTGFQVETLDGMIDRLRMLVQDPDLRVRMGAAAVEHARKFDWDVVAALWQNTYLQIAGRADDSR